MQGIKTDTRLLVYVLVFLFTSKTNAQRSIPSAYPVSISKSYIRAWEASKPGLDGNNIYTQLTKDGSSPMKKEESASAVPLLIMIIF